MTGHPSLAARLVRAAFSYPEQPQTLLHDVSLTLESGCWYGVVGANGAGKSTLLRLLAGDVLPTSGEVRVWGARCYVPQEVETLPELVAQMSQRWDAEAMRWRSILELNDEALWRWETCSCGERKRWQVGAALMSGAEVLLLDEPSNHLDATSREVLWEALRQHRGLGVLVSHDRSALDALTRRTLWVESGQVSCDEGSYSVARELRASRQARQRVERAQLIAQRDAMASSYQELSASRERASRDLSSGRRMKSVRDHDASSALARGRVASAERTLGRRAGVARGDLERAEEALSYAPRVAREQGALSLDVAQSSRAVVAHLALPDGLRAGDVTLVEQEIALTVRRGERIWLRGDNGAGKTTLLEALLRDGLSEGAQVLWMPQELGAEAERALLRELDTCGAQERGAWLQVAAVLGVQVSRLLEERVGSPGMWRKLLLARGLSRGVSCVVLDEPTNHLDLPSIEALSEALRGYEGALVLVTHDAALGEALTEREWRMDRAQRALWW